MAFFHGGPKFAQFAGHGGDAVGFLHAPTGDVAQRGGALRIQRHHGQRHGRVGDVVAIEVDGLEWPCAPADVQRVGGTADVGPHGLRRFHKADVALNRVQPHALDGDAIGARTVRCQCPQRDEVAGRGRIAFHVDSAR